jgi:hypothetical protein
MEAIHRWHRTARRGGPRRSWRATECLRPSNCAGEGSGNDYANEVWIMDDTSNFQAGKLGAKKTEFTAGIVLA